MATNALTTDREHAGTIRSDAFWSAALRSERQRIVSIITVMVIAAIVAVGQKLAEGGAVSNRLLFQILALVLLLIIYEAGLYVYLGRKIARAQQPGLAVWVINVIVECATPSAVMLISMHTPRFGAFWPFTAPVVLAYYFFIITSTLRLNPLLCILTGAVSAGGYVAVLAYAFAQYRGQSEIADALPLPVYGTYAAFILLGGFAAAGVAKLIRGHVIAALHEAETRKRIEHDLDIARSIQQGLLPTATPSIGDFDIAGWSQPADATGGDYFDWQPLPNNRLAVSLADVTGHGIGPALVTAVCRAYARASFPASAQIGELVGHMNDLLVEDLSGGRFVTFVVAVVDATSSAIDLVSAGHGPILHHVAAEDRVDLLDAQGIPLGIAAQMDYAPPTRLTIAPGDTLLLITDGFVEWANSAGELFGAERLSASIRGTRDLPADQVIARIYADVTAFAGGTPQMDDLTAVVIKRKKHV